MNWRESVSEGFPRRNRDEPPSLRRDIADELGDHLACALARELERTGKEPPALALLPPPTGAPWRIRQPFLLIVEPES